MELLHKSGEADGPEAQHLAVRIRVCEKALQEEMEKPPGTGPPNE